VTLPVQDIIEWDVLNWAQLIRHWTPVLAKLPRNSKVLAIGERNGGLSAWMALQGFQVVCTDREYPSGAKLLHDKLGVSEKIEYRELDIVHCAWQPEEFDVIIAKSVIGGLKDNPADRTTRSFTVQQKAIGNIYALLKKGGYFFSAENMEGGLLIKKYRALGGKDRGWRYLHPGELSTLYGIFETIDFKAFGIVPTLFRYNFLNVFSFGLNKCLDFLPVRYKYIIFVTAAKG
jgi:SAM-dependent methyltransferase